MFFVPLSTDAPIYYRPWGTLGLIVANVLVFIIWATGGFGDPDEVMAQFGLVHGDGIHPVQWVTSSFLHGGLVHLTLNMFFLWAFGLVVEGKVGTGPFLGIFAAIAVGECAIEQISLLWMSTGVTFGTSSAIYGLMAMALIWAPRNEMTVGYTWILRTGLWDVPIQTFALLMIVLQLAMAAILRFRFSGELLHLVGAAIGAGLAWLFLKKKWVDCENWDLFSVMQGRHITPPDGMPTLPRPIHQLTRDGKRRKKKTPLAPIQRKVKHLERLRSLLADGKPFAAYDEWTAAKHFTEEWAPFKTDIITLGSQLQVAGHLREALEVHLLFIERFPSEADRVRIEAAEILFRHQKRPHAAVRACEPLDPDALPTELAQRLRKLRKEASVLIDSGHLEIEGMPNL
jgi:membrane associated rhomboid family serine protease